MSVHDGLIFLQQFPNSVQDVFFLKNPNVNFLKNSPSPCRMFRKNPQCLMQDVSLPRIPQECAGCFFLKNSPGLCRTVSFSRIPPVCPDVLILQEFPKNVQDVSFSRIPQVCTGWFFFKSLLFFNNSPGLRSFLFKPLFFLLLFIRSKTRSDIPV